MTTSFKKAFINKDYLVKFVDYDGKNYFQLISEQSTLGNRQIIINSKLILLLTEYFFSNKNFNIIEINLANNEDDSYVEKINEQANNINENRKYFDLFKQELEKFCTEDSIEISGINLKDKKSIITLKSNGILTIHGKLDYEILCELEGIIGSYFYEANK
ncbi:hypothetical protein ACN68I_00360 [Aerococcus viridans]|uniref:hypothetical protein n=1 Tax=Aerococcus viridans TaxID=1377 RepID=UPI003B211DB8